MSEELKNVTLAANDMAREIERLKARIAELEGEGHLTVADVVAFLVKKAREYGNSNRENRAKADAVFTMASKVSRGAIRPTGNALDDYRAEILREAADKLALEMVPETAGAGPGFMLAIRLCVRSLRRMSDRAVTS